VIDADALLVKVDQRLAYPPFLVLFRGALEDASRKGVDMYGMCLHRTPSQQMTEYLKGRQTPGPGATPANPLGSTVTKARPWFSYHQYGIAGDAWRDGNPGKPGLQVSWEPKDYAVWAECAKARGLRSLGASIGDWPHVELPIEDHGLSLAVLRLEALSARDPIEGMKRTWALLDKHGPWKAVA